jgi:two-component system sensor histidine kinase MtrB
VAEKRSPGRFRRRLAVTFVIVVALSSGLVAVVTVIGASESRLRNFRSEAIAEARFTAAVAPANLDGESFDRLRLGYESRSDANLLAISGTHVYSSARNLSTADIPAELRNPVVADHGVRTLATSVNGRPTFVVAAPTSSGDLYYSFFSMAQLRASRQELTRIAATVWLLVVLCASAIAFWVSRRILRPVAAVATTAEAIASGDLGARLPDSVGDELGTLSTSFNHMADEVERMVDRSEAAAERERRFTADVAHELRTPLTGMSASATILHEQLGELPERVRRPAGILINDVSRLRVLVLELLELARLDAGDELPRIEPLRLRNAVRSVARTIADGRFDVEVDPEVAVLADPTRLQRILANVLGNARRHGAGAVTVTATREDDTVALHVIDDGPGLRPGEEERVFDRFYKSEQSRAAGGSGLGLAISREHARSMGGELVAANEPGRGARFTLRLPVDAAPPEGEIEEEPSSTAPSPPAAPDVHERRTRPTTRRGARRAEIAAETSVPTVPAETGRGAPPA